jgi:16S rRNA (cytosine967-C5)-methyltransferase
LLDHGVSASATLWSPQGISLESRGRVESLPGFREGLFQIQGEASQLVGYLLGPSAGERVLDACAAPGGKTTHLAELMDDRGDLIALDKSARGVEQIRENAKRLNLTSPRIVSVDVTKPLDRALQGPYDRILVDAPCSGLGTLRAHPEIKWHRQEKDIQRLSDLQSKILNRVATYVKSNGVLVYSTCTLTRDENDRIVDAFLAEHKGFELDEAARYLPESAERMTRGNYFQALPHRDNADGFFAARMRKVS